MKPKMLRLKLKSKAVSELIMELHIHSSLVNISRQKCLRSDFISLMNIERELYEQRRICKLFMDSSPRAPTINYG